MLLVTSGDHEEVVRGLSCWNQDMGISLAVQWLTVLPIQGAQRRRFSSGWGADLDVTVQPLPPPNRIRA